MSREELASLICTTLDQHGIRVVLSGEAAASIYAPNPYESMDLDFIQIGLSRKVDAAMKELGFNKEKGRHWTHPDSEFWVEFPPGPVQIGDTIIHEFAERRTKHGTLRILTATDSVMDRLAWFYHANDPQGLEQAVAVATSHRIDLKRIQAWSAREGAHEKFERFRERVHRQPR
jgi:hypothetical protein